jgi:uncharacterized protein YndB with AHSA1/START domain
MARDLTISDSIVVEADPVTVYEKVSDPTNMGNWSPENRGATVADANRPAYVGMVFDGHNKRGKMRWTTRCTVTAADPGELFRFRVGAIGLKTPRIRGPIATWEYRFENVDGKTKVTETWSDDRRRWPDAVANMFDRLVTRGHTLAEFQRQNIHNTLRQLADAFMK